MGSSQVQVRLGLKFGLSFGLGLRVGFGCGCGLELGLGFGVDCNACVIIAVRHGPPAATLLPASTPC